MLGALLYALGLALSSLAVAPLQHQLLEILVGFGIAGTGFGVILAVVARATSDQHRSMALAITTAAGSAGQVVGPPLAEGLLGVMPWQSVFLIFAGMILAVLLVLPLMKAPQIRRAELEESMGRILGRALRDPSFTLVFLGFFSCGYQLGFITAHFPAFVTELCGPICAFHGRWASIPRDRGHGFHGIVGGHSTPRAVWPTGLWSQSWPAGSSGLAVEARFRRLSPASVRR